MLDCSRGPSLSRVEIVKHGADEAVGKRNNYPFRDPLVVVPPRKRHSHELPQVDASTGRVVHDLEQKQGYGEQVFETARGTLGWKSYLKKRTFRVRQ